MGKKERDKGARGEREAAESWRDLLGLSREECYRGVQHDGTEGKDIKVMPGLHVEVKRVERLNVTAALDQAIRDAQAGETPVLMHRRNKTPWLLTIRFQDLLSLFSLLAQNLGSALESQPTSGIMSDHHAADQGGSPCPASPPDSPHQTGSASASPCSSSPAEP